MNYFSDNAKIIGRRWPQILKYIKEQDVDSVPAVLVDGLCSTISINGIQLTSRHDRIKDAQRIITMVDKNVTAVGLYGTGLGDVQRELLKKKTIKLLHVVIMNAAIFSLVLHLTEQMDWLKDPRVKLVTPEENDLVISPFIYLMPELELADEVSCKIRDRVVIQSRVDDYNAYYDSKEITDRIASNMDLVRQDADVADLYNTLEGREVYVFAAGPTLNDHLDKLRKIREQVKRPFFIAVDTAMRALMAAGIKPDLVMTIDKNIHQGILNPEWSDDLPLVYNPMAIKTTLLAWRGKRYASYEIENDVYNIHKNELPRGELFRGGSVIHPATDVAIKMGASKITLFGADFSFAYDKTHAGWDDGVLGSKKEYGKKALPNGYGKPVKTLMSFTIFLNSMEHLIRMNPHVKFFNASREGARILGTTYHEDFA
ncbi:MAG: motility associated factor glycosyltransferase family protein [Aeromonas sp.]